MNDGFIILLVLSGWALLSIMVAVSVGNAAGRRDVETEPRPSEARGRRIAS